MRVTLKFLPLVFCLALAAATPCVAASPGNLRIYRAEWLTGGSGLFVTGRAKAYERVRIENVADGSLIGAVTVGKKGTWEFSGMADPAPCGVAAVSGGLRVESAVQNAPASCGSTPPNPVLAGLTISGPDTVPENSSAAYAATARYSDGSSKDVTPEASWTVDSGYGSIDGGEFQAREVPADQQVTIRAVYSFGSETRMADYSVTILDGANPPQGLSHSGKFTVFEGTNTCLGCHYQEALEMHASVHYQWQGDARDVLNASGPLMGKLGGINDFCIYPDINWIGKLTNLDGTQVDGGCAKCHAGLGLKPDPVASTTQLENIDCLLCHSETYKRKVEGSPGSFRFVPALDQMTVPLLQAAQDITLPSSQSCLNCHAFAGGGNNYKRGDLEKAHASPPRSMDVHMASRGDGGAGLTCLDCHAGASHRIAGRGSDLRPLDSDVPLGCTDCHAAQPHSDTRLNAHTRRVDCTVCHIPAFAKTASTDMDRDWSHPGVVDPDKRLYEPYAVHMMNVVPEYRFFNGKSYFYNFGEPAVPGANGRILMSGPAGDVNDPAAKIHAFKHHLATQPVDPGTNQLVPLKIGLFFMNGDIDAAIQKGMEEVGLNYSATAFARTERYMGLFHEVAPKEDALGCNSCHNGGSRMDFDALGYTPKDTRNGRPLCASCHDDKSGAWSASELFTGVHQKHVSERRLDCSNCHNFSAAR